MKFGNVPKGPFSAASDKSLRQNHNHPKIHSKIRRNFGFDSDSGASVTIRSPRWRTRTIVDRGRGGGGIREKR